MDKRKVKDFLSVVGEESTQAVLESKLVPQIVSPIAETVNNRRGFVSFRLSNWRCCTKN